MAEPFDAVAPSYDAAFTHRRLGRSLRQAVWAYLEGAFEAGERVLELGCGTGEDAVWLARRGVWVVATDASTGMLEEARRKLAASGVEDRVSLERLDLTDAETCGSWLREQVAARGPLDGVLSNFGPLNCLAERRTLARQLAGATRPGARLLLVLMGPCAIAEALLHLLAARPRDAFRRLRSGSAAWVGGTGRIRVWYPSPGRLRRELRPWFRHRRTIGVGVVLPPSDLGGWAQRRPRPFERLAAVDRRIGRLPGAGWVADHYLLIAERRGEW